MVSKATAAENAAEFAWQHDDVFGRIASRYDLLCDVFSFGIPRFWKRAVARRSASEEWSVLLDGASGTGDIVLRLLAHHRRGAYRNRLGYQPKMLAIAQRRLKAHGDKVRFTARCRGDDLGGR